MPPRVSRTPAPRGSTNMVEEETLIWEREGVPRGSLSLCSQQVKLSNFGKKES